MNGLAAKCDREQPPLFDFPPARLQTLAGLWALATLPGVQSHWINFMWIAPRVFCFLLSGIKERSARNQEIHSNWLAIMSSSGKYPRKVSVKFKKLEVRERERGWRRRARKHTPTNSPAGSVDGFFASDFLFERGLYPVDFPLAFTPSPSCSQPPRRCLQAHVKAMLPSGVSRCPRRVEFHAHASARIRILSPHIAGTHALQLT